VVALQIPDCTWITVIPIFCPAAPLPLA